MMKSFIVFFGSLLPYIIPNDLFAPMLTNRTHKISIRPKFPAPQNFSHRWLPLENLSCRKALYQLDQLLRTIYRNRLNQKMHMIPIGSHLQKCYLIPLRYLQTYFLQNNVHLIGEYYPAVLRGADKMVHQQGNIMTLTDKLAHEPILHNS